MKTPARQVGDRGEQLAAAHYQGQGYQLVERNFRTRLGEVDLILKKDGLLVFCEVKARGPGALAAPAASVNARKQRRLALAAQQWLQMHRLSDPPMRFDVAEVRFQKDGAGQINLIENAF